MGRLAIAIALGAIGATAAFAEDPASTKAPSISAAARWISFQKLTGKKPAKAKSLGG